MARPIEHRATFGFPAERVHAAFTDETYLRERLATIGGRSSELVSHRVDNGTAVAVMRQGIDPEHLPQVVRKITPGGVLIERTETWRGGAPYRGGISATVSGMPGTMEGTLTLADITTGCTLTMAASVKVGIPLVGGKIEAVIVEQLAQLLEAESRFTTRWLERRG
jgi:hypothetical protein